METEFALFTIAILIVKYKEQKMTIADVVVLNRVCKQ